MHMKKLEQSTVVDPGLYLHVSTPGSEQQRRFLEGPTLEWIRQILYIDGAWTREGRYEPRASLHP